MPGKERLLASFEARVETSVIGGRAVRGRLRDRLVLPLGALNVHIAHVDRVVPGGHEVYRVSVQGGCTRRGVLGGVYIAGWH